MVILPRRKEDRLAAEKILYETAGVQYTPDLKTLVWLDKNKYIRWVVGYNNFLGRSVQVHLGSIKGFQTRPRQLLYAALDYPFNVLHVNLLIGIINSVNKKMVDIALKLGFKEKTRWENMHDDGGLAQYIRIDGSAGLTQFDKDTKYSDTRKAVFGNSGDLQIYHGGGSSFIKDDGDGGLYLQTNGPAIYFQDTDGNALAQFTDGGACFLMYDGATKFQTTSDGISLSGNGYIDLPDNGRARFGAGYDLAI